MSATCLPLASSFAVAFIVSWALAWLLTRNTVARLALDEPNARSLHARPVPRTGGLALLAGSLAAWLFARAAPAPLVLAVVLALAAVSFRDDLHPLSARVRLLAHFAAAGALVYATTDLSAHYLLAAGLIFAIVWMTNLYNFMDGSDGLAGGMAIAGFLFYAAGAAVAGNTGFAATNIAVAGAAGGFLVFNFHPARIFLGDVGSIPLGFLAAFFGITGWLERDWPWWFPVVVFSPFIVDATLTLARRLARGERVWEAHRNHYYQRLVRMGWGHRRTALAGYLLMAACGGAGLVGMKVAGMAQTALFVALFAAYAVLIAATDKAWRRHAGTQRA